VDQQSSWVDRGSQLNSPQQDLVLLTLGTGVGAGVILGGKILHGAMDNAAELGHMIVVVNGLPCPCGQRGCLEQYASAAAVARQATAAIQQGESSLLASATGPGESIDAEMVARAAQTGDPLAMRVWDQACLFLAITIINIQHAYNPGTVLLGGGMSAAGESLLTRVRHYIEEHKWSLCADLPEVRLASLGNDAGVMGAAGLVWNFLEQE
jgi:glucokinase